MKFGFLEGLFGSKKPDQSKASAPASVGPSVADQLVSVNSNINAVETFMNSNDASGLTKEQDNKRLVELQALKAQLEAKLAPVQPAAVPPRIEQSPLGMPAIPRPSLEQAQGVSTIPIIRGPETPAPSAAPKIPVGSGIKS